MIKVGNRVKVLFHDEPDWLEGTLIEYNLPWGRINDRGRHFGGNIKRIKKLQEYATVYPEAKGGKAYDT